jgi:UDP-N-acetylglucosamine--N-acetylmuramyl-(pentapeptide) pyrophosphoryl-undecaprenol N-acetylglucosamine transferase
LTVARVLAARGHDVTVWLGGTNVEGLALADWTGPVVRVRAEGFLAGAGWLRRLTAAWRLGLAVLEGRRHMRVSKPAVVLGMGSYACVGPAVAAWTFGVPLVLHEANVIPGRAVSLLSRMARFVAVTFGATRRHIRHAAVEITGMPVRRDLSEGGALSGTLQEDIFTVLVMGGSQGSRRINEVASRALGVLVERGVRVQVVHLCGPMQAADVLRAYYAEHGVPAAVREYLTEMGKAYAIADLAVCRAGAATCMELAACGIPAVLIPFPFAARDHQTANAEAMESACAAVHMPEHGLTVDGLAATIDYLASDGKARDAMGRAMAALARPDAAERLADLVERAANR